MAPGEGPPATPATGAGAEQVETTLFRALAVLRAVVLVYVVVLNASRWRELDRPVAGWLLVGFLVLWTGFVTWAYDAPRRRTPALLVADLAVAMAAILLTPWIQSDAMLARHASTMPSFWVMAAVLACAIKGGWAAGVPAALLVSLCDLAVRAARTGPTWGNIFLLVLAAGIVGYAATLVREATEARLAAERVAAAVQERARLARVVHDGVLQVLAMVQRRGTEIGGEAAELGRLAGEQEVALRALVQGDDLTARHARAAADGTADLVAALGTLGSRTVSVSVPAGEVRLPAGTVGELLAVCRACLDNVAAHVGPDAPAWLLVEDLGDTVAVSVRDEGPGIADGRLEQAGAEGRLGVRESICGRMRDLGGSATLHTGAGQGTEWELVLPRSVSGSQAPAS